MPARAFSLPGAAPANIPSTSRRNYPRPPSSDLINPLSVLGRPKESADRPHAGPSILIAGCGTGEHPFDIAQKLPEASILAIDLSGVSLAYARRKTREE